MTCDNHRFPHNRTTGVCLDCGFIKRRTIREEAREGFPLRGPDAKALEYTLQQVESELAEVRELLAQHDKDGDFWHSEWGIAMTVQLRALRDASRLQRERNTARSELADALASREEWRRMFEETRSSLDRVTEQRDAAIARGADLDARWQRVGEVLSAVGCSCDEGDEEWEPSGDERCLAHRIESAWNGGDSDG